jgi:hypothetical protein
MSSLTRDQQIVRTNWRPDPLQGRSCCASASSIILVKWKDGHGSGQERIESRVAGFWELALG